MDQRALSERAGVLGRLPEGALAEADELRRELREQAIRDPLTGLFNRRYLEEILTHEVGRARRVSSAVLHAADAALYRAKELGGGRVITAAG